MPSFTHDARAQRTRPVPCADDARGRVRHESSFGHRRVAHGSHTHWSAKSGSISSSAHFSSWASSVCEAHASGRSPLPRRVRWARRSARSARFGSARSSRPRVRALSPSAHSHLQPSSWSQPIAGAIYFVRAWRSREAVSIIRWYARGLTVAAAGWLLMGFGMLFGLMAYSGALAAGIGGAVAAGIGGAVSGLSLGLVALAGRGRAGIALACWVLLTHAASSISEIFAYAGIILLFVALLSFFIAQSLKRRASSVGARSAPLNFVSRSSLTRKRRRCSRRSRPRDARGSL